MVYCIYLQLTPIISKRKSKTYILNNPRCELCEWMTQNWLFENKKNNFPQFIEKKRNISNGTENFSELSSGILSSSNGEYTLSMISHVKLSQNSQHAFMFSKCTLTQI